MSVNAVAIVWHYKIFAFSTIALLSLGNLRNLWIRNGGFLALHSAMPLQIWQLFLRRDLRHPGRLLRSFGLYVRFFAGTGRPSGCLEICHNLLDINALLGQEPIQGLAGFFQCRDIRFGVALRRDEIAYRLTMARDGNGRTSGNVFSQVCSELPDTDFDGFHDLGLIGNTSIVNQCVHILLLSASRARFVQRGFRQGLWNES